jgi:hypothetical protein
MDTTTIIIVLLVVIVLVFFVAIYRNKNLRQKLHLPGISWDIETTDGKSTSDEQPQNLPQKSSLDFGDNNEFGGKIQNIVGRDISSTSTINNPSDGPSSVNFGKGNIFKNDVKNVAGRDIIDKDKK